MDVLVQEFRERVFAESTLTLQRLQLLVSVTVFDLVAMEARHG